jgi:hypothetical protein
MRRVCLPVALVLTNLSCHDGATAGGTDGGADWFKSSDLELCDSETAPALLPYHDHISDFTTAPALPGRGGTGRSP